MTTGFDLADDGLSFDELSAVAAREFGDIADFIWKTPRFLEAETELELRKLKDFRDYPELMESRWRHESGKLKGTFPFMLTTGNLFGALSIFESYLMRLAFLVRRHSGAEFPENGRGARKWLTYLKRNDIRYGQLDLWPQIDVAFKVRDAMIHAGGVLAVARTAQELREIVSTRRYLCEDDRKRRASRPRSEELGGDELQLASTPFGDRLVISFLYPWLLCSYARDFLAGLGTEAARATEQAGPGDRAAGARSRGESDDTVR